MICVFYRVVFGPPTASGPGGFMSSSLILLLVPLVPCVIYGLPSTTHTHTRQHKNKTEKKTFRRTARNHRRHKRKCNWLSCKHKNRMKMRGRDKRRKKRIRHVGRRKYGRWQSFLFLTVPLCFAFSFNWKLSRRQTMAITKITSN